MRRDLDAFAVAGQLDAGPLLKREADSGRDPGAQVTPGHREGEEPLQRELAVRVHRAGLEYVDQRPGQEMARGSVGVVRPVGLVDVLDLERSAIDRHAARPDWQRPQDSGHGPSDVVDEEIAVYARSPGSLRVPLPEVGQRLIAEMLRIDELTQRIVRINVP